MKLLHKLHSFFNRLPSFLSGSLSSVSLIFAELEPSLLSIYGAFTIIAVESSLLSLKVFFESFFYGRMVLKKIFI